MHIGRVQGPRMQSGQRHKLALHDIKVQNMDRIELKSTVH